MKQSYSFDTERFRLGPLCKRGHEWENTSFSLRYARSRSCVECDKAKSKAQAAAGLHAKYNREKRATCGRPSRAKGSNGEIIPVVSGARSGGLAQTVVLIAARGHSIQDAVTLVNEYRLLWESVAVIKKSNSVADLVVSEQRRYWQEHPEAYHTFCRERSKERARWRQMTDPEYRLYHRQKSKRRKALLRGSIGLHVKPKQLRSRFAEFDNCCAYCGVSGEDLHIEHVIPISKGGTHVIGNIVPACQRCNFSKSNNEVEHWFRRQSFFTEARWKRIRRVLGWDKSSDGQLSLL